jgi:hypothetical protein
MFHVVTEMVRERRLLQLQQPEQFETTPLPCLQVIGLVHETDIAELGMLASRKGPFSVYRDIIWSRDVHVA